MPRMIPTLGHRSLTAAVLALRAQDLPPEAIAERVGAEVATVRVILSRAKQQPCWRFPRSDDRRCRQVRIDLDVLLALHPEAKKRHMPVNVLVRHLLATVADEGLVDAVLDDGAEAGRP